MSEPTVVSREGLLKYRIGLAQVIGFLQGCEYVYKQPIGDTQSYKKGEMCDDLRRNVTDVDFILQHLLSGDLIIDPKLQDGKQP
jgi:hypothetical protein